MLNRSNGAPRHHGLVHPAILAAAALAVGSAASAQNVPPPPVRPNVWVGTTTPPTGENWNDPANWEYDHDGDPLTPPNNVLPSNVGNHFAMINNGGLAIVDGVAEGAFLTLGTTYRGPGDFDTGHLRVDPGAVLTLGELRIGGRESMKSLHNLTEEPNPDPYLQDGGIGTVVQNGGTVNVTYTHGQSTPGTGAFWEPPVQSMYVGDSAADRVTPGAENHAEGTYHLIDGALNVGFQVNDQLVIGTGYKTKGTFTQDGGNVVSFGNVFVARRGAIATYDMGGGTLTVHGSTGIEIGNGEAEGLASTLGTFTQTGGTVTVRADVRIGRRNGTGVYNLSHGTLNIATIDSIYTTGTIPNRGTLNIGSLGEGMNPALMNSTGTFNLSGDAVINIGRSTDLPTENVSNLNVGLGNNGTGGSPTGNRGFLEMTGGTINMHRPGANITIGNGTNVIGTANISAGTINNTAGATSSINLGVNQGGGTLTLSGTGVINTSVISFNSGSQDIVRAVEVNGGTLNVAVINFGTSNSLARRSFKVTSGTADIGELILGAKVASSLTSTALADISGGTVTIDKMTLAGGSEFKLSNMNLTIPQRAIVSAGTGNIGKFTVAAGSTLTLAGGVTSFLEVPITPAARAFQTFGPGTLTIQGTQSYEPLGTTLHHNAGTLNLDSNANGNLTINANSTANLNSDQRLTALNVANNSTTTMTSDGDRTLHVNNVSVATGAKLDMTNNDMIVDYTGASPEFTLRDKVLLARDGGAEGIFFTGSDNIDSDTILAFGETAELAITEFNGVTGLDNTTVVGKYTYYGDANFDGQVTTDDYVAVDLGLGTGNSWVEGDFNLDGFVTTDDYVVVDLNLGKGTTDPLAWADEQAEMIALHTEMFGQSYVDKLNYTMEHGWVAASVPEPGALSLVGLGALGLIGRRRRR